ncbi:MAG: ATP-binding protein [Candidatus Odinarchaeota archaeon]
MEKQGREQIDTSITRLIHPQDIDISLNELGGLNDVIENLLRYGSVLRFHDRLEQMKIKVRGKILLYGPPGTGKTSLAYGLAKMLQFPLIELQLPRVFSSYLGETGQNVQKAFDVARQNAPAILFLDEFDALARARSSKDEIGEIKRVVNILLTEFDKINFLKDKVLTICATNHEQILDRAVWRRFDEIIAVPLPNKEARSSILSIVLRDVPNEIDIGIIAEITDGWTGSDMEKLVRRAAIEMLNNNRELLTTRDLEKLVASKEIIQTADMDEKKPVEEKLPVDRFRDLPFQQVVVTYDRDFYQSVLTRFPFETVESAIRNWRNGHQLTKEEKILIQLYPFIIHEDEETALKKLREAKNWWERQQKFASKQN